jgi:hypothetical protein
MEFLINQSVSLFFTFSSVNIILFCILIKKTQDTADSFYVQYFGEFGAQKRCQGVEHYYLLFLVFKMYLSRHHFCNTVEPRLFQLFEIRYKTMKKRQHF